MNATAACMRPVVAIVCDRVRVFRRELAVACCVHDDEYHRP
jgi:hypothetical protein